MDGTKMNTSPCPTTLDYAERVQDMCSSATQELQPGAITSINESSNFDDTYRFTRDIHCIHPRDKCVWYIESMSVLSNNELVCVDPDNKSVKIIDIDKEEATGYIKFNNEPSGITTLPNGEVAVTFQSKQLIRILTTEGGLSIKQSFKVHGKCLAIEYCNDKLYVSYCDPVMFQIFNLSGELINIIQPDAHFLEQCDLPSFIAIHSSETKMYVSDNKKNIVLCMDMNGVLLHMYKDARLGEPGAICFSPAGTIYLCNSIQHTSSVLKISDDLSETSVILSSNDTVCLPKAMCICHGRKTLYVSSIRDRPCFTNVIKEFEYN